MIYTRDRGYFFEIDTSYRHPESIGGPTETVELLTEKFGLFVFSSYCQESFQPFIRILQTATIIPSLHSEDYLKKELDKRIFNLVGSLLLERYDNSELVDKNFKKDDLRKMFVSNTKNKLIIGEGARFKEFKKLVHSISRNIMSEGTIN